VGNSAAGITESKTAVILPVMREITTVAEVKRPEMTARDEATTAIEGMLAVAIVASSGYSSCWPIAISTNSSTAIEQSGEEARP